MVGGGPSGPIPSTPPSFKGYERRGRPCKRLPILNPREKTFVEGPQRPVGGWTVTSMEPVNDLETGIYFVHLREAVVGSGIRRTKND